MCSAINLAMILALILAIEVRIEEAVTRTYRLHSSLSCSEKAIPVSRDGEVVAVLDIEGRQMRTFDETDRGSLER